MPKTKLKNLNKANGNARPEIRTMDQLLGRQSYSEYGTFEPAVYKEKLEKMSWFDLQEHALAMGFHPTDNKKLLKDNLMNKFRDYMAGRHVTQTEKRTESLNDVQKENVTKVKQILKENFGQS